MFEAQGSNREKDIWSGITTISAVPGSKHSQMTWDSHAINNWILLLTLEGAGKIRIDTSDIDVAKFDIILITPNTPHTYLSSYSWKLLWLHFPLSADILNHMIWPETIPKLRKMTISPQLFASTKFLLHEANNLNINRQRSWFPITMKLIEVAILRVDAVAKEQGKNIPWWVPQAMELLNSIDKNVRMDDIARKIGLSRASFYNAFRKATGYSPGVYCELRKLRHAEQLLLQTNTNIAQIAYQCGYDNPLYFSLRFRKYYGYSPRNYRNMHSSS